MCKVEGCDSEKYAAGLCSKHYNRLRTTGTTDEGPKARAPVEQRFWRYVTPGAPDECWEWKGGRSRFGHGVISLGGANGTKTNAHRISYLIHFGNLPESDGKTNCVLHSCDNPACVNPAHLRLGTQKENIGDVKLRDRRDNTYQKKRDAHPNAKMTMAQVMAARDRVANGGSMAQIAKEYGVTRQAVRYACKRGWQ